MDALIIPDTDFARSRIVCGFALAPPALLLIMVFLLHTEGIGKRIFGGSVCRDCCKKSGRTKIKLLVKNPQLLLNQADIQVILPAHELIIFNNFHNM